MDYSFKEEIVEAFFEKIKSAIIPSNDNNYRSRFLQSKALLYFVILLLVVKIGTTLVTLDLPKNIFFADITKSALQVFVNQARYNSGLNVLTENSKLEQAAMLKAQNMLHEQYFNHVSPSGVTPWFWFSKAGYNYKYAGENLAIGFFDSKEVFNAWLNSPSHKENILNPKYTEVGTAVLDGFGGKNTIVVVQEFASPLVVKGTAVHVKTPTSAKKVEVIADSQPVQQISLDTAKTNIVAGLQTKAVNYIASNYEALLQDIVYGVSLVVIGILLALIFLNFNITLKKQLIFRGLLIIGLLSVATMVNREFITALMPHQILI